MLKIKLNNINSTILYLTVTPYLKETELKIFALFSFSNQQFYILFSSLTYFIEIECCYHTILFMMIFQMI